MNFTPVRFEKNHNTAFYTELKKRVNTYFKANNISKHGNANMVIKTVFMLTLYVTPLVLIFTVVESSWFAILMWALMGFGMAGIGLSVMHDANHGAYSSNKKVNQFVGYVIFLLGGSDVNWRIQHNILHHTYTNVSGIDEDINPGAVMRFSPHEKRRALHRFQHFYAWFFYGLMTLMWFLTKDYRQAMRYREKGLIQTQQIRFGTHMVIIVVSKLIFSFVMIALPIWLCPVSWWVSVLGFLLMEFIAGFTLGCIFQPAHVVPTSTYTVPDESGNIQADWAVNQLFTTANFAPKAKFFSWFVGGLNFQVEHHLFPNICHVHYPKLSKIVEETAKEFNLPYHSNKTFIRALIEHGKMLRNLGRYDEAPAVH